MASERASSTVKGNRFVAILRLASFFPRKLNLPRLTRSRTDRRCPPFSPRYPSCFPYPSLILHESGARCLAPPRALFSRRFDGRPCARPRNSCPVQFLARPRVFLLLLMSTRETEERGGEVERGRRSTLDSVRFERRAGGVSWERCGRGIRGRSSGRVSWRASG